MTVTIETATMEHGGSLKRAFHAQYPDLHAVFYRSGWSFYSKRDGYLGEVSDGGLDEKFQELGEHFA